MGRTAARWRVSSAAEAPGATLAPHFLHGGRSRSLKAVAPLCSIPCSPSALLSSAPLQLTPAGAAPRGNSQATALGAPGPRGAPLRRPQHPSTRRLSSPARLPAARRQLPLAPRAAAARQAPPQGPAVSQAPRAGPAPTPPGAVAAVAPAPHTRTVPAQR